MQPFQLTVPALEKLLGYVDDITCLVPAMTLSGFSDSDQVTARFKSGTLEGEITVDVETETLIVAEFDLTLVDEATATRFEDLMSEFGLTLPTDFIIGSTINFEMQIEEDGITFDAIAKDASGLANGLRWIADQEIDESGEVTVDYADFLLELGYDLSDKAVRPGEAKGTDVGDPEVGGVGAKSQMNIAAE